VEVTVHVHGKNPVSHLTVGLSELDNVHAVAAANASTTSE
jgi:hypothetical protein